MTRGAAGQPTARCAGRGMTGSRNFRQQEARLAVRPIEHETERLRLVVWDERHIAPFAAINADAEVMRYFLAPQSAEQSRASVDAWADQFAAQGWSNWAVELKDTGEFIGFIGLSVPRRQLPFSPCVEIGWRLGRRFWRRGLATEGARSCLRVAFEQLALQEVVSFTALVNLPSRAVMERIGMRNAEQDFEHPALPAGHHLRPHCLYRITRGQWAASAV